MHRVLDPVWFDKPVRARRLRERIEAVLDYAKVRGLPGGREPGSLEGPPRTQLSEAGQGAPQAAPCCHALRRAARLHGELTRLPGLAARALEFTILTAARSGEARLARWSEFDLSARLWTIPGERMKGGKEHRVPLSSLGLGAPRRASA